MKRNEFRALAELSLEELRRREGELRDEIFRLRMKRAASALDDRMAIRNKRRDLARVLTLIGRRTAKEAQAG